jgi:molybdate transport system substrate-binding protein
MGDPPSMRGSISRLAAALLALLAAPPVARADELVVFAASSLKEAFEGIAAGFETAHPGVKVKLAFAGSQEHGTQIEHGAPADVWAAASRGVQAALARKGLVGEPRAFARNEPVVVVPKENPAGIHAFADLPRSKRLVVGSPEVPIGAYTVQILDKAAGKYGPGFRARVEAAVVSHELNVRQVLAKVTLGEADAAVVYRTDARAAKAEIEIVAIPAELNVLGDDTIAAVAASKRQALARAFIDLVLAPEGQRRLSAAGFLPAGR